MSDTIQDKILLAVLDNQEAIKALGSRLDRIEAIMEKSYSRMDDFLRLIDRHEAEIAAMRSAYQRLEERLEILEKKIAV